MKKKYNLLIVISIILAIIGGIYLPNIMEKISFLGTIYINLLKFMIIPIIFTSIAYTIYDTRNIKQKILIKTILIFIIMFIVTFLITSLIISILKPGINFKYNYIAWNGEITNLNYADIIVNLFPSNLALMIQNNALFGTIIFAVFFGLSASKVVKNSTVMNGIKELKLILEKLLEYIMYLTPLGILALLGNAIAQYGTTILNLGLKYILYAYLCTIIAIILVMILPAYFYGKVKPFKYIKKMGNIWLMTITTCSSVATLPTTIKTCKEEFKIPDKITNITVPLGCTIHMCGGAVSFALLGIFSSQLFGIDITISKYIIMIISALLINMAAPGIPNGGIVIGASYLTLLGIPITFIGFYSSIYKLLDMAYTTLNVTGDVTANIIINKLTKSN